MSVTSFKVLTYMGYLQIYPRRVHSSRNLDSPLHRFEINSSHCNLFALAVRNTGKLDGFKGYNDVANKTEQSHDVNRKRNILGAVFL